MVSPKVLVMKKWPLSGGGHDRLPCAFVVGALVILGVRGEVILSVSLLLDRGELLADVEFSLFDDLSSMQWISEVHWSLKRA